MEITFRSKGDYIAELTVKSENTTISEDVLDFGKDRKRHVKDGVFQSLINAAFEVKRFDRTSDVDTVKEIFDAFLSDTERQQFIDLITEPA